MFLFINIRIFVFIIVLIPIVAAAVFWYIHQVKPVRMLNEVLRRYRETGNTAELGKYDFSRWPEVDMMLKRISDDASSETKKKYKMQQAEYLALQNQINPHFLFNTLEDIRGDALEAGMRDLARTIAALATYFRYTITEPENLVLLEDELDNVNDYYTVQRYRFGDRMSMSIQLPDDRIEMPKVYIPKLTLQPIVENAISHGLEGKTKHGELTIRIELTSADLLISVKDNGCGMNPEEVKEINERLQNRRTKDANVQEDHASGHHTGIALRNINRRIKLLFGDNYGIHIFSMQEVGTDVQVRLPLVYEKKA